MLSLSPEKAWDQSEEIKKLVEDNEARDYKEADLILDLKRAQEELNTKEEELDQAWDTIAWLNEKHERLIEEFKKILIESTTGLKRRELLFKDMDQVISRLFGCKDICGISDEELLAAIKTKNPNDFASEPLHVMLGDMSYLALANESGHRQGDELLEKIGATIKKGFKDASRHGGDEFTTLVLLQKKEVEEKIARLEEKIKKIKNISLEYYGLDPNMDIGLAHFSEGLKSFQDIIRITEQDEEGRNKLAKLDILKELQNIWLDIADKRSMIKKATERIALLIDKIESNPQHYKELYKFLNKGAYGIETDDLEEISNKIKNGSDKDEIIFDYIKRKEIMNLEKKSGYERIKEETIIKTADKRIL